MRKSPADCSPDQGSDNPGEQVRPAVVPLEDRIARAGIIIEPVGVEETVVLGYQLQGPAFGCDYSHCLFHQVFRPGAPVDRDDLHPRRQAGDLCRFPDLANSPLFVINQAIVLDYMNARMREDGVKPATVNREKAFLSEMLTKAVTWGYLERNLLEGMENLKEPRKRDVDLTPEQAARLIEALPTKEIKNIVAFAIYSGLRLEAILDLRIEDVNFLDSGSISKAIGIDKGGDRAERVLSRQATEILRLSIGEREAGHVFTNPRTGKRFFGRMGSFDRAVRKLGLTAKNGSKLRFHDLRHVYGNWLHRAGVSLDELRVLYGHRDRSTTDRYITPDLKVIGEKFALHLTTEYLQRKKPLNNYSAAS